MDCEPVILFEKDGCLGKEIGRLIRTGFVCGSMGKRGDKQRVLSHIYEIVKEKEEIDIRSIITELSKNSPTRPSGRGRTADWANLSATRLSQSMRVCGLFKIVGRTMIETPSGRSNYSLWGIKQTPEEVARKWLACKHRMRPLSRLPIVVQKEAIRIQESEGVAESL